MELNFSSDLDSMWRPPVRIFFDHYTWESPFAQEAAPPYETFGALLERRLSKLLDWLLMIVGLVAHGDLLLSDLSPQLTVHKGDPAAGG